MHAVARLEYFWDLAVDVCSSSVRAPMRYTRKTMRSPSKLWTSTRRLSLTAWPVSSIKCRSRIPPLAFNSASAVRSFKAWWDRFVVADPHYRESSATTLCRSRNSILILRIIYSKGLQYSAVFCGTSGRMYRSKQFPVLILSASRWGRGWIKQCCRIIM